jgi:hypothetical protein
MTMPPPIRPDGDPTRIVKERIGKDQRGGAVVTRTEGANLHARDLL